MRPFRIEVPEAELVDLRDRLGRARWPEASPVGGWRQGVPLDYLRELAGYWRDEYEWRAHEARLNELDQFVTEIDGARVHFIHARAAREDATPLLLLHGWPGSVVELEPLIAPLRDPPAGEPAFHLVVPSLPGYGFSGPLAQDGWDVARIARAMAALMAELGYGRYAVHGGDWGAGIARQLGVIDPEHVRAVHLTMLGSASARSADVRAADADSDADPGHAAALRASRERGEHYRRELSGYMTQQSTRPQTLAYALTDSPVGQLAWIAEKFFDWTDSEGRPEDAVDRDRLLTDVSVYWFTRTAGSSARLYWETAHGSGGFGAEPSPCTVPTAVAVFPRDLFLPVREIAERHNRIERWSAMAAGGHFAGMEQPEALVSDLRAFLSAG